MEPSTNQQSQRTRMMLFVLMGVLTVAAATVVGRYFELGANLAMDLQGTRAMGTAERRPDGAYRLRYDGDTGIHARTYRGGFGIRQPEGDRFDVRIVYDPDRPNRFQPSGLSYLPGALVLMIFCIGMSFILAARRLAVQHRRSQRGGAKDRKVSDPR